MPTDGSSKRSAPRSRNGFRKRFVVAAILVCVVLALFYFFRGSDDAENNEGVTFAVVRGPLEITVLEGGSIEAKESQELKSEVQGQTKILSIIEEGYQVTEKNVEDGLVLIELDSTELLDKQTQQELQYQNSKASYTDALEQYDIQINQNESDIKAADLAARFARMDFEKYLGASAAGEIVDSLGLAQIAEAAVARAMLAATGGLSLEPEEAPAEEPEEGAPEKASEEGAEEALAEDAEAAEEAAAEAVPIAMASTFTTQPVIDFGEYATVERLGDGEARQNLRKLEDGLALAQEDVGLARTKFEGTGRLFEKDFVTKNELDNDQIALKRKEVSLEAAGTSRELFIRYEFPKQAEKLLSDYEEALRKLERASKMAVSKMAQADAKLNSSKAQYELQTKRRKELQEQIDKCIIRATKPGLVVYGGGQDRHWRQEQIEEGAAVRERQVIITIPDTAIMTVEVKVHESYVKRIAKEQRARIRIDAYPEKLLEGEVTKIAVLPDSQNRWMNPDLKVYPTTIVIEGSHEWIKPGMSAEAEIIIAELDDVLHAPLQAVFTEQDQRVCYMQRGRSIERRVVDVGEFNDAFIEIHSGVDEGDVVLLRVPEAIRKEMAPPEAEEEAAEKTMAAENLDDAGEA